MNVERPKGELEKEIVPVLIKDGWKRTSRGIPGELLLRKDAKGSEIAWQELLVVQEPKYTMIGYTEARWPVLANKLPANPKLPWRTKPPVPTPSITPNLLKKMNLERARHKRFGEGTPRTPGPIIGADFCYTTDESLVQVMNAAQALLKEGWKAVDKRADSIRYERNLTGGPLVHQAILVYQAKSTRIDYSETYRIKPNERKKR